MGDFCQTSEEIGTGIKLIQRLKLKDEDCVVSGCNGELCVSDRDEKQMSLCVYKKEFACYKSAKCERQANNKCGWTMTKELKSCLNSS